MTTKTELRGYAKIISDATGLTDARDLSAIEEIMRQDIFCSTLDWQTLAQLCDAAREGAVMLIELRKMGYYQ